MVFQRMMGIPVKGTSSKPAKKYKKHSTRKWDNATRGLLNEELAWADRLNVLLLGVIAIHEEVTDYAKTLNAPQARQVGENQF